MKLKSILLSLAMALAFIAPASAETTVIPNNAPCILSTTNVTVCSAAARVYLGAANLNTAAQTATVQCWDNPTTNSGTTVAEIAALGTNGVVVLPVGFKLVYGLTCKASASPTGGGIAIFYD